MKVVYCESCGSCCPFSDDIISQNDNGDITECKYCNKTVKCSGCGLLFSQEEIARHSDNKSYCPKCLSIERERHMHSSKQTF